MSLEQSYIDTTGPEYNISKNVGLPNPPPNRPIVRTDMNTGESTVFATRDLAALDGGFNEGSITACCHGHAASHRGYFWKFVDGTTPEFVTSRLTDSIVRSNLDGYSSCIFLKIADAVTGTPGSTYSGIHGCCNLQQQSHCNYLWKFINPAEIADLRIEKVDRRPTTRNRLVRRISIADGSILLYEKISDVSLDGYSIGNVTLCCEEKRNAHKGFFWEWADRTDYQTHKVHNRSKGIIVGTSVETGESKEYLDTASVLVDGFSPGKVSLCVIGRRKSHKGYTWKRL
jgi:hypothetical protein